MNFSSNKKTFTDTYIRNLSAYIFLAIIGGVFTGYYLPELCHKLGIVSRYFFTILEILIFPVIFLAIVTGICNLPGIKNPSRIIWQTFFYFLIITSVSIILGFFFAFIIEPGANTGIEISKIKNSLPKHLWVKDESLLGIMYLNRHGLFLVLSIIIGISFNISQKRSVLLAVANKGMNFFYWVIKYLYTVLPIIIFCNIAYGISLYGIKTLLPLSKIVATVYLTNIFFVFGILGLVSYLFRFNLWKFLIKIKEEILLVITTSSSKTAFPMIFEKMENEKYNANIVGFIVPLGYNFNLAGACIYISVACVFLIQFYNITLSMGDYIWLFIIISISSKTASGVPGSGFLALIFTLNKFGKIPTTDLALLYSVDRFMNEARAVTNFIGIAVSAAIITKLNQTTTA